MARVLLTASTISATSLLPIVSISVVQGKSILLSALVGFLTGPGNSAAVVFSCADSHPTEAMSILLLTVCYACTSGFDAPAVAIVVMLSTEHTV